MDRTGWSSHRVEWIVGFVALVIAVCLVAQPARAAKCVNPGGTGGCFVTIQAAVTAAVQGETITVRPGTYNELVVIPAGKNGLRLVGGGTTPAQVLVSGFRLAGAVIVVDSPDVLVRNLTVANSDSYGILVTPGGAGAMISTVAVRGCGAAAIRVDGNAEVRYAKIRACVVGIHGSSGGAYVARQNTIDECTTGILLEGQEILVTGNRLTTCPTGIFVTSITRANVTANSVRSARQTGIAVESPGGSAMVTVRGNVVEAYGPGIRANGAAVGVENNTVLSTGQIGINVNCMDGAGSFVRNNRVTGGDFGIVAQNADAVKGLEVSGNTVHGAVELGAHIRGDHSEVRDNLVYSNCSSPSGGGIRVDGSQCVVARNRVFNNGGAGIISNAAGGHLTGNTASGNVVGIRMAQTGATLLNNTTLGNSRYGILLEPGAVGTTVENSTAKGNLAVDFCDAGAATTLIGNHFVKTSTSCP